MFYSLYHLYKSVIIHLDLCLWLENVLSLTCIMYLCFNRGKPEPWWNTLPKTATRLSQEVMNDLSDYWSAACFFFFYSFAWDVLFKVASSADRIQLSRWGLRGLPKGSAVAAWQCPHSPHHFLQLMTELVCISPFSRSTVRLISRGLWASLKGQTATACWCQDANPQPANQQSRMLIYWATAAT